MTVQLIGAVLILAVLAALFAFMARVDGWRTAVAVWAFALALSTPLILGAFLLAGGW